MEPGAVQLEITTDKPVYSAAADSGATPILANVGQDTVYALMGEWVYLEKLVDDEWTFAAVWFVYDGATWSFPVAPGTTRHAPMMRFGYVGKRPGTYRFVFVLAYDPEMRHLLPKEQRVSPPFELKP